MRFSFIHAADLHIDSPLASLGKKNAEAAERFAAAGRKAVTALIDETLTSGAKFLVIAGDIFDGDWGDYTTGLFFIGELARLERADIPVFIVRGNHDAESKMTRALSNWPSNVRLFSANAAESFPLDELHTVLHGKSFADRIVPDDFVSGYPAARSGWLNVGVLHTALDGVRGHASYAPCTPDDLKRFGYDYWALGHIHKQEIVSRDPWIVFPGNIQGRSVRETGPKGAMRVNVEDGRIVAVEPIALDAARWAHETIDVSACEDEDELFDAIRACVSALHAASDGRALAMRLSLTGVTGMHAALGADPDRIAAEAQAIAESVSSDCWIERLRLKTSPPARPRAAVEADDAFDIGALLEHAAADPDFAAALEALGTEIGGKLPKELQEDFQRFAAGEDVASLAGEAQAMLEGLARQVTAG
ncbi:MAG: exonuclease SbcCD subunit D [Beijerinckiaceae bacterium]